MLIQPSSRSKPVPLGLQSPASRVQWSNVFVAKPASGSPFKHLRFALPFRIPIPNFSAMRTLPMNLKKSVLSAISRLASSSLLVAVSFSTWYGAARDARGEDEFKPDQSTIPATPPKGAIVLLGEKEHAFLAMNGEPPNWPFKDGVLTSTKGKNQNHIVSKWHFRDADIHVEFKVSPQGEGNSGIYIHGHYELQILNSYGRPEDKISQQDEGSIYGFAKPLVNAAKPVGEWQLYDIRYHAPRRNESGAITEPGRITAWLNGSKVQENTPFEEPRSVFHPFRFGTTPYLQAIAPKLKETQVGPVFLQDHNSPAEFRNIWIVPLDDKAKLYEPGK